MADTIPLKFSKSATAGGNAVGIEITSNAPKSVWSAIIGDKPLPSTDFELVNEAVRASGGKEFALGAKQASFNAEANAYASLGIYQAETTVSALLQIEDQDPVQLNLPAVQNTRFGVLRWGYDLRGAAKGAVALGGGAGSMSFSGQAQAQGLNAVIRIIDGATGTRTALQSVVDAFCLPSQIDGIGAIPPGTFVYSEVNGSLELGVKGTFGWDFDWIRSVRAGELVGDIGLKIALDVEARFGFKASGRYAVVVSRGPDPALQRVRVRVHKLKYKGWEFGLDAGATVESKVGGLPQRFDDFIAAVLGTHGTQFIRDLRRLEGWAAGKPLPEVFADAGATYVEGLLQKFAGGAIADFEKARERVLDALDEWDELPDRVSSLIWKSLGDATRIAQIRDLAREISTADAATVRSLVDQALGDAASPSKAQFLDLLSEGGVFDAVLNRLDVLQHAAGKVASALDSVGQTIDVIQRLHDYVNQELSVDKIRAAATAADVKNLDPWLKGKLGALLGKVPMVSDLEKFRTTIGLLAKKWDELYEKATRALQRKYDFSFSAAYSRAATRDALIDIEFDLAAGAVVAGALADAIDGRFADILTSSTPGIMVFSAALTHGVERHSHIGMSLPFYKVDIDHINSSLAKGLASDADGERVLIYELNSTDKVTELVKGRLARESRLALGLTMPILGKNHSSSARATYSFRSARVGMRPSELRAQLAPIVESYFEPLFATTPAGKHEPFETWVAELDGRVPHAGSNLLGNTFVSFDLAVPERAVTAWLKAPADKSDHRYREMSVRIQSLMRQFIPLVYFSDPTKYNGAQSVTIAAILTYASSPFIAGDDLYWDPFNPERLSEVTMSSATRDALAWRLGHIHDLLVAAGLDKIGKQYSADLARVLQSACASNSGSMLLRPLFSCEKTIISKAWSAALDLAEFQAVGKKDPDAALRALESFGERLTSAFNENASSIYTRAALRPLGPLLLMDAARAFDDSLGASSPAASLRIAVVKSGAPFPSDPNGDLEGYEPVPGTTLATDRIVRMA